MPTILSMLPSHRTSVELFAGGAIFTFSKPRAPVEILNDIDGDLIAFYRVLQNPDQFDRFYRRVVLTPYSRQVWSECRQTWSTQTDPVDRVYRWFVLYRQGFSGTKSAWGYSTNESSSSSRSGMAVPAFNWLRMIDRLPAIHDRLQGVELRVDDWESVVDACDRPDVLFYADPPYVLSTRKGSAYKHEMTDPDHRRFVDRMLHCRGMVIISGYDHPIYTPLVDAGWSMQQKSRSSMTVPRTKGTKNKGVGSLQGDHRRIECIWISPNCGIRQASFDDLLVDAPPDDLVYSE